VRGWIVIPHAPPYHWRHAVAHGDDHIPMGDDSLAVCPSPCPGMTFVVASAHGSFPVLRQIGVTRYEFRTQSTVCWNDATMTVASAAASSTRGSLAQSVSTRAERRLVHAALGGLRDK
jgi:hypothetical protein